MKTLPERMRHARAAALMRSLVARISSKRELLTKPEWRDSGPDAETFTLEQVPAYAPVLKCSAIGRRLSLRCGPNEPRATGLLAAFAVNFAAGGHTIDAHHLPLYPAFLPWRLACSWLSARCSWLAWPPWRGAFVRCGSTSPADL
jgi:hypothetical protein